MIRIGFVANFDSGWLGGVNYFRNLWSAITATPELGITPVVFTEERSGSACSSGLRNVEVIQHRMFERGSFPWLIRQVGSKLGRSDLALERLLIDHNIAILSHSPPIGSCARIPTLGWIADFQYKHYPALFPEREVKVRDRVVMEYCRQCTALLMSSQSASRDLERFFPGCSGPVFCLPFVAVPPVLDRATSSAILREKYRIAERYFYLPNQFWQHKNHRVVVDSLRMLRGRGRRFTVVATGNTQDYRSRKFFSSLMDAAREVEEEFRVLGVVPYEDVLGLMRDAVAVLNPSLFEGWSTTVEEAKTLGKTVILSDIPVHREQAPERSMYFDPCDPEALAACLIDAWTNYDGDERQLALALACAPERLHKFAHAYSEIVRATIAFFQCEARNE